MQPSASAVIRADGTALLSWSFAANPARTGFKLETWDLTSGSRAWWGTVLTGPSSSSTVVQGLLPGRTYAFTVTARLPEGDGAAVDTTSVRRPTPGCSAAYCVVVDAAVTSGPAARVAQGFLHGATAATSSSLLTPLAPTAWRIQPYDVNRYAVAKAAGGSITMVLSDGWMMGANYAGDGRPIRNPWDDWTAYTDFVKRTVTWQQANNMAPDYWDIQNEPESARWYSPSSPPTRDLVLQQFRVAYAAIRAVQPDAKIIGPSMGNAAIDVPSQVVDFRSFLADAAANGLKYDAISWHDGAYGPVGSFEGSARAIAEHVAWIRQTLALYPSLGNPLLFVNEYGAPFAQGDPGTEVAYLTMLEQLGIASAVHSCFPVPAGASSADTCFDPRGLVDGLITTDGRPTPTWWVHRDYAAMSGTKILADGNAPQLPAFATRAPDGEIDILVGNDFGCSRAVTSNCPPTAPLTGPIAPSMAVDLPVDAATHYNVTVDKIRYQPGAMDQPDRLPSPLATFASGLVTATLPSIAGGEALFVRLLPTAPGPGPVSPGPQVDPSAAHLGSALYVEPDPGTRGAGILSWAW